MSEHKKSLRNESKTHLGSDLVRVMEARHHDAFEVLGLPAALLTRVQPPGEEEWEDPRKELVDRLLEYERFKEVAQSLEERDILERDVFVRKSVDDEPDEELELSLFELIEAIRQVLSRTSQEFVHTITLERISLEERITQIIDRLTQGNGDVDFIGLFDEAPTKELIILTFLAILELVKLRMIKIYQRKAFSPIKIRKR